MALFGGKPQSWKEKVLSADNIWAQVEAALKLAGAEMPKTPRRPDVRLVLDNVSGLTKIFRNPAGHGGDKSEQIPASGEKTAAMVMVEGASLAAQYESAQRLYDSFNLGAAGLSDQFLEALKADRAGGLVSEAYGPAPFAGQAGKLLDLNWAEAGGATTLIKPVKGVAAAFGARAAELETAMAARVRIAVQGTGTIAENIQDAVMVIAVASDWQTKAISTRPIVASVARGFYGAHYDSLPVVTVNTDGLVQKVDLKDGRVIDLAAPKEQTVADLKKLKLA